jgi:hypothetical protein
MGVEEPSSQLSELAYYYPEPYWLAEESSWVKSLLLFFDGIAILLPEYMSGRELVADPTLAEPLADLGLLTVLQPEWFVDQQLADRLAEGMVELLTGGAFDGPGTGDAPFTEISMSRMGFAPLSTSRMGSTDRGVFEMILGDLKRAGLARDSEDGVSVPLRRDVRHAYLLLLAQEARAAGHRHGYDLQPTTDERSGKAVRDFLELSAMPSRQDVIGFDLMTASVDLDPVPLDEVLDFRRQHGAEHRDYMLNLREFAGEVSTAERPDRRRLLDQRQDQLSEQAAGLMRRAIAAFKKPAAGAGFAISLTGAAWSLATGNPIGAGLGALGAAAPLLPGRDTGSAYSYIFRAHQKWS